MCSRANENRAESMHQQQRAHRQAGRSGKASVTMPLLAPAPIPFPLFAPASTSTPASAPTRASTPASVPASGPHWAPGPARSSTPAPGPARAHLEEQLHALFPPGVVPDADLLVLEVEPRPAALAAVRPEHGVGAQDVHLGWQHPQKQLLGENLQVQGHGPKAAPLTTRL